MSHQTQAGLTLEELLLQFCFCDFNFNCLVNLLVMSALMIGVVLNGSREKGIDECGFSEPRFSCDLITVSFLQILSIDAFPTIIVKAAPRFATILCLISC